MLNFCIYIFTFFLLLKKSQLFFKIFTSSSLVGWVGGLVKWVYWGLKVGLGKGDFG